CSSRGQKSMSTNPPHQRSKDNEEAAELASRMRYAYGAREMRLTDSKVSSTRSSLRAIGLRRHKAQRQGARREGSSCCVDRCWRGGRAGDGVVRLFVLVEEKRWLGIGRRGDVTR